MAGKSTLNRLELCRPRADPLPQDQPRRGDDRGAVGRSLPGGSSQPAAGRSSSTWTPPTIRCTAIRRAASSTAITTATATCRSTSSAAAISWRPSFAGRHRRERRRGGGDGPHRGADPRELAGGADPAAGQFRLRPRGPDGLVRGQPRRLSLRPGAQSSARREDRSELAAARTAAEASGEPARRFKDFEWSTRESWSRERRVVAKAEWTQGEANPRFVVTSLKPRRPSAQRLYEELYCARGDMENRIKECQLDLFADRTSAATMRANQLRLWFASFAYVLVCALRRIGLERTQFARHLRHHPPEAAQDRRARPRLGPPHPARYGLGLPQPARIRARPRPAGRRRALTNQTAHRPQSPRPTPPHPGAGDPCPPSPQAAVPPASAVPKASFSAPSTPTTTSGHPCCEKCGLARISQTMRCIEAANQRNFL